MLSGLVIAFLPRSKRLNFMAVVTICNDFGDPQNKISYCCSLCCFSILNIALCTRQSQKICQQIWKTKQWPQDWKRSVFIPIPKKGNAKECSNYRTIALISHTSKAVLKILQARFQQYINHELPNVQAGFRKGRGTRDQIAHIHWIIEKSREFQEKKHLFLLHSLC